MNSGANPLQSQWLNGQVRHRRLSPVLHTFQYKTGMLALDLDEWSRVPRLSRLFSLERFNWLSLRRRDYFEPGQPDIGKAVRDQVEKATGWHPDGPIELITHPRYLGVVFNPVSFYCCYESGDDPLSGAVPKVIAAQITNTPWGERHLYCLQSGPVYQSSAGWQTQRFEFSKQFHVSPYNAMDQDYRWIFSFRGRQLRVQMNSFQHNQKVFDATLDLKREPLTRRSLHQHLIRFPLESIKVVAAIYWQALKLKVRGAAFQTHPDKLAATHPDYRRGANHQGQRVDNAAPQSGKVSSWRT
jgi:DUF1365 family protein